MFNGGVEVASDDRGAGLGLPPSFLDDAEEGVGLALVRWVRSHYPVEGVDIDRPSIWQSGHGM